MYYWIDFTDIGTEGKWVTFSTGKSEYTSWDRAQPDNGGGHQHCALNNFSNRAGRWDDEGCKNHFKSSVKHQVYLLVIYKVLSRLIITKSRFQRL